MGRILVFKLSENEQTLSTATRNNSVYVMSKSSINCVPETSTEVVTLKPNVPSCLTFPPHLKRQYSDVYRPLSFKLRNVSEQ